MQDYLMECRRLRKENEALRARIAELEAANQWHDASEPPEKAGYYLVVVVTDASRYIDRGQFVSHTYPYFSVGIGCSYDIEGWRDLPPLPEATE